MINFKMKISCALAVALLTVCSACGQRSKLVSILGDSYSTFEGYVTPSTNALWYFLHPDPNLTDVSSHTQTWWYRFIDEHGYHLCLNNSCSGSTICNTGYNGLDASNSSLLTRSNNLGNPDIIFVFGATNDDWAGAPIGEYKFSDWTKDDTYSFRPAMAMMLDSMKARYKNAEIYFILNDGLKASITESCKVICQRCGIPLIAISGIDKRANHPTIKGMGQIVKEIDQALYTKPARDDIHDMFVCTQGTTNCYSTPQVGNMTYTTTNKSVKIGGDTYSTEAIDSIKFNPPTAMKYIGGDLSRLPQMEASQATYRDASGNKVEPLPYLHHQGWNTMRVRLFVNPDGTDADNMQSLDYVAQLGRRIKDAGYQLLVDFHYSDRWADQESQTVPAAWGAATSTVLADSLYNYTKSCLQTLIAAGATPDLIQTGNEIGNGMLWDAGKVSVTDGTNWQAFATMLKRAVKACREVCPWANVILHTGMSGDAKATLKYYTQLKRFNVDYDMIGLSYFPPRDGYLAALDSTLSGLEMSFPGRPVLLVECGYPYSSYTGKYDYTSTYAATPKGQKAFTDALVDELLKHFNTNGLLWWYPEENSVATDLQHYGLFDCSDSNKALPALFEMRRFK
jgi:arabinogalactan endo-1,4-beta-galactosidase